MFATAAQAALLAVLVLVSGTISAGNRRAKERVPSTAAWPVEHFRTAPAIHGSLQFQRSPSVRLRFAGQLSTAVHPRQRFAPGSPCRAQACTLRVPGSMAIDSLLACDQVSSLKASRGARPNLRSKRRRSDGSLLFPVHVSALKAILRSILGNRLL